MSTLLLFLSVISGNSSGDQYIFSDSSGSTKQQLYLGYFPTNNIVLKYDSQVAGACDYATYAYSPCSNGVDCGGNGAKQGQVNQWCGAENTCVRLSSWDNGMIQPSYDIGAEIWRFTYQNGETYHCQNSSMKRIVNINWHCNMNVLDGIITSLVEPEQCNYFIDIDSKWACLGQIYPATQEPTTSAPTTNKPTTSIPTTSIPTTSAVSTTVEPTTNEQTTTPKPITSGYSGDPYTFTDSSGSTQQQLDLGYFPANNIVLKYDSPVAGVCDYATYAYSPCRNAVDCGGDEAKEGQVNQWCGRVERTCVRLSSWDNGLIQPSYNISSEVWTFKYQNGESYHCQNSSNRTVIINWHCNMNISNGNITSMSEPGGCNYIIDIDSKWSCLGQIYDPPQDDESTSSLWVWIVVLCTLVVGVLVFLTVYRRFKVSRMRERMDSISYNTMEPMIGR